MPHGISLFKPQLLHLHGEDLQHPPSRTAGELTEVVHLFSYLFMRHIFTEYLLDASRLPHTHGTV